MAKISPYYEKLSLRRGKICSLPRAQKQANQRISEENKRENEICLQKRQNPAFHLKLKGKFFGVFSLIVA
jgi:hypothetical protein